MEDYIDVLQTARKVFIYANEHNWSGLQSEVFADKVTVDDSSYPGAPLAVTHTAARLVENWKNVFTRIQHSRHLLNNELVVINGNKAMVHAFVTGIHVKTVAEELARWTVYSTYDIELVKLPHGWRVVQLTQHFQFQEGHPSMVVKGT